MKKLLIILVLILMAGFISAESYAFDGDIWTFRKTVNHNSYIISLWDHDSVNSNWGSIDPEEWGLVSTIIGIVKDVSTGNAQLIFMYRTKKEYYISYYIISSDKEGDITLLGGQRSNKDFSENYYDDEDGFFYSSITINLTPENIEYLSKDLYFDIAESYNGYNIYFGIPKEIFNVSFDIAKIKGK